MTLDTDELCPFCENNLILTYICEDCNAVFCSDCLKEIWSEEFVCSNCGSHNIEEDKSSKRIYCKECKSENIITLRKKVKICPNCMGQNVVKIEDKRKDIENDFKKLIIDSEEFLQPIIDKEKVIKTLKTRLINIRKSTLKLRHFPSMEIELLQLAKLFDNIKGLIWKRIEEFYKEIDNNLKYFFKLEEISPKNLPLITTLLESFHTSYDESLEYINKLVERLEPKSAGISMKLSFIEAIKDIFQRYISLLEMNPSELPVFAMKCKLVGVEKLKAKNNTNNNNNNNNTNTPINKDIDSGNINNHNNHNINNHQMSNINTNTNNIIFNNNCYRIEDLEDGHHIRTNTNTDDIDQEVNKNAEFGSKLGILLITDQYIYFLHEKGFRKKNMLLLFKLDINHLESVKETGKITKKLSLKFNHGTYNFKMSKEKRLQVEEFILSAKSFSANKIDEESLNAIQKLNISLDKLKAILEETIFTLIGYYGKPIFENQNMGAPNQELENGNNNDGNYSNARYQAEYYNRSTPPYHKPDTLRSKRNNDYYTKRFPGEKRRFKNLERWFGSSDQIAPNSEENPYPNLYPAPSLDSDHYQDNVPISDENYVENFQSTPVNHRDQQTRRKNLYSSRYGPDLNRKYNPDIVATNGNLETGNRTDQYTHTQNNGAYRPYSMNKYRNYRSKRNLLAQMASKKELYDLYEMYRKRPIPKDIDYENNYEELDYEEGPYNHDINNNMYDTPPLNDYPNHDNYNYPPGKYDDEDDKYLPRLCDNYEKVNRDKRPPRGNFIGDRGNYKSSNNYKNYTEGDYYGTMGMMDEQMGFRRRRPRGTNLNYSNQDNYDRIEDEVHNIGDRIFIDNMVNIHDQGNDNYSPHKKTQERNARGNYCGRESIKYPFKYNANGESIYRRPYPIQENINIKHIPIEDRLFEEFDRIRNRSAQYKNSTNPTLADESLNTIEALSEKILNSYGIYDSAKKKIFAESIRKKLIEEQKQQELLKRREQRLNIREGNNNNNHNNSHYNNNNHNNSHYNNNNYNNNNYNNNNYNNRITPESALNTINKLKKRESLVNNILSMFNTEKTENPNLVKSINSNFNKNIPNISKSFNSDALIDYSYEQKKKKLAEELLNLEDYKKSLIKSLENLEQKSRNRIISQEQYLLLYQKYQEELFKTERKINIIRKNLP
ncbi:MAG: hypothetical protein ACTSU2_03470 [Promethearchaeota archaeon]